MDEKDSQDALQFFLSEEEIFLIKNGVKNDGDGNGVGLGW